MEPLLGILLDQQPRPTHLALRSILQNLYKQMMEPIPGLNISSVERHALPALEDGFGRKYKQEWMESFCKHLEQYDVNKLQRKSWWNSLLQLCQGNEEFSMNLVQNIWNTQQRKQGEDVCKLVLLNGKLGVMRVVTSQWGLTRPLFHIFQFGYSEGYCST